MLNHLLARFMLGLVFGSGLAFHAIRGHRDSREGSNPNAGLSLIAAAIAAAAMLFGP